MFQQFLTVSGTAGNWDLSNLLKNAESSLGTWGGSIIAIIGLVLVIVGVYQIAKGLISGGRGQVNWVMAIICIMFGGAIMAGGLVWIQSIAAAGKTTLEQLGTDGASGVTDKNGNEKGGGSDKLPTIIPFINTYTTTNGTTIIFGK